MGDVAHAPKRWYLRDDLRAILRAKVVAGEGYDVVGGRVGISGPALHNLLNGKTATSFAVPALCKLYGIDPLEYLPLDDEQLDWLRVLEELRASGRDPSDIVRSLRSLVLPARVEAAPPTPPRESSKPESPSRARPGRVRTRGTQE